jgi:Na+/melibiose symporter-like transporter
LICFAWIFFRAQSFATSIQIIDNISRIFYERPTILKHGSLALLLAVLLLAHWVMSSSRLKERLARANALVFGAFVAVVALALIWFTPAQSVPFIYFQF